MKTKKTSDDAFNRDSTFKIQGLSSLKLAMSVRVCVCVCNSLHFIGQRRIQCEHKT